MQKEMIYAVDMGAGKHSCYYLEDECPTLTRTNYGEPVVVYGVDVYNQCLTGGDARTIMATKNDNDHIPCVVIGYENETENEQEMPLCIYQRDDHQV